MGVKLDVNIQSFGGVYIEFEFRVDGGLQRDVRRTMCSLFQFQEEPWRRGRVRLIAL